VDLDDLTDWPEDPPIVTDMAGDLVLPSGYPGDRQLRVEDDEVVLLGCPGTTFGLWGDGPVWAACSGAGWWNIWNSTLPHWSERGLGAAGCSRGASEEAVAGGGICGPGADGTEIAVEFDVGDGLEGEAKIITVCHHLASSSTLWARHSLWDEIALADKGGERPKFKKDSFYDYDVNEAYSMDGQLLALTELVGSRELAEHYIQGGELYLARGHLAPNADFIFDSWRDATFHYVNAAPQWQSFNARNWATLEDNCRQLAVERGLDLVVYTGTHAILELPDVNGVLVPILLHQGRLPVPRYFWKVLHDPMANSGVALVGLNNPHSKEVDPALLPCPALASHPLVDTVDLPQDVVRGYVWACRVEDLAANVPEVPELPKLILLE